MKINVWVVKRRKHKGPKVVGPAGIAHTGFGHPAVFFSRDQAVRWAGLKFKSEVMRSLHTLHKAVLTINPKDQKDA